ncbi:MAG: hypothetical protein PVF89_06240 [Lysobacterales bacterium]|jgi:uncharacterized membrane protein
MVRSQKLATLAQSLYLANLLAIPVVALLLLCLLRLILRARLDDFSRYHFRLALLAGCIALLLLGIPALIFLQFGPGSAGAWTSLLMYLLIVHTSLVVFGIYSLARAMTGNRIWSPRKAPE